MCESHAFLLIDGTEKKVLEDVDQVEVNNDEVRLVNIFGEQKVLKAKLKLYDNNNRKIVFVPV